MNIKLLPRISRFIIYPVVTLATLTGIFVSYTSAIEAKAITIELTERRHSSEILIPDIKNLALKQNDLLDITSHIDKMLPQLSTTELDLLSATFQESLISHDITHANMALEKAMTVAALIVKNQEQIAQEEVIRLRDVLKSNVSNIDLNLGDSSVVPADATSQLNDLSINVLDRLNNARTWVQASADELKRRRSTMDEAQKQIVMIKSENILNLYENGQIVYSMPISLGRPVWNTRSGDFSILDKLGTVWSYWQIWLPNWMGIYFAGSSENGIHGLPFDDYGNTYWTKQVGKQNITYGCVMPDNPDMVKLYEWAEVGVPVAIVN